MKKIRLLAVALAGAIAVVTSGCYFLPDEEEIIAPPTVKTSETTYTTVTATKKDLEKRIVASGTIVSDKVTELAYENQGGTVKKIYVRAGDEVRKGDIICELDTYDLDYQIREKELYIKRAQLQKEILEEQGALQTEIDKQQVEIEILENELGLLQDQKEEAFLYSDVSGTVSALGGISAGDNVAAGQVIATIIDPESVYMEINPSDISAYKMDMDVLIRIDGEYYDGVVFMIPSEIPEEDPDAEEDENTINYSRRAVYIRFKDTPPENCVNVLADTILVLDSRKDVIVIANNLIKTINGEKVVYVLKDGKRVAVPVETGLETGSQSVTVSGISEGDEIVIR